MKRFTIALVVILIAQMFFAPFASADDKKADLVQAYLTKDNWVIKLFALIELKNQKMWDAYEAVLIDALKSKDENLRLFAVASACSVPKEAIPELRNSQLVLAVSNGFLEPKKKNYVAKKAHEFLVLLNDGKNIGDKKKKWEEHVAKNADKFPEKAEFFKLDIKKEEPVGGVESGKPKNTTVVQKLEKLSKSGLDLMLCVDVTGSMDACVGAVQEQVQFLVGIILAIAPTSQIGFVCYNDNAWVGLPFSSDLKTIQTACKMQLGASAGGDWEEGVDKAHTTALFDPSLKWREGTWKNIIIIGDAPPHAGDVEGVYNNAKKALEGKLEPPPPDNNKKKEPKKVATGKDAEKPVKLIEVVTSTIQTYTPGSNVSKVEGVFMEIAKQGGGTYTRLEDNTLIINQIIMNIFGKEWENVSKEFVVIYKENINFEKDSEKKK